MSHAKKKARNLFFSDGLIIHLGGLSFKVQSQTTSGLWYVVCIDQNNLDCECAAWRNQKPKKGRAKQACYHIEACRMQYAVRIKGSSQLPKVSNHYSNAPWYNAVKRVEKRCVMELLRCLGALNPYVLADFYTEEGASNRKRPPACAGDLLFFAGLQAYENTASRFTVDDPQYFEERGFLQRPVLSPSTLSTYMAEKEMTKVIRRAINRTAMAVHSRARHFAIDSAYFRTPNSEVHLRRGELAMKQVNAQLQWVVDLETLVAIDAYFADEYDSDQNWFIPVMKALIPFTVESIHADSGYSDRKHYDWVRKNLAGPSGPAKAWIDFKDDNRRKPDPKYPHYTEMLDIYLSCKDQWHEGYDPRCLIEVAHHIMKARFKRRLRSRLEVSLENELLAMVLVHNLCRLIVAYHQHGVIIPFADDRAMTLIDSIDKSKFELGSEDQDDGQAAAA